MELWMEEERRTHRDSIIHEDIGLHHIRPYCSGHKHVYFAARVTRRASSIFKTFEL